MKIIKVISSLLLLLVLLVGGGLFYIRYQLSPVTHTSQIMLEIDQGCSPREISALLKEKDIIRHHELFYQWMKIFDEPQAIQAGQYVIETPITNVELMSQLKKGFIAKQALRITFPEGLKVDQVIKRFTEEGLGDEARFRELCNSDQWDYDFLPENRVPDIDYRLEGFLYPDTYDFYLDASEEDMIKKMLDRFDEIYSSEDRARAKELDMTDFQVITMASVIEKEAKLATERSIIAGVFYNRLQTNMALQSCATVQYLFEEPKEVLLIVDTEIESPYNTYLHTGLPPGPIASPGRGAIEAALWPDEHDYYYFVANDDGSHDFNKTYGQHLGSKNGK